MEKTNRPLSDAELIEGLSAEGAAPTIRYLYRHHYDSLRGFVVQNGGSDQDAQDIFQEVMVSFVHLVRQGKFRGESSIKTFLYSMNRNIWYNELKKRGRSAEREKKYSLGADEADATIERTVDQREAQAQLLRLMERLGESCKKVLLLFYYQNLPMKEIVNELGYENEQVARNKKYKCLKKLEEMLAADSGLAQQLKSLLTT